MEVIYCSLEDPLRGYRERKELEQLIGHQVTKLNIVGSMIESPGNWQAIQFSLEIILKTKEIEVRHANSDNSVQDKVHH